MVFAAGLLARPRAAMRQWSRKETSLSSTISRNGLVLAASACQDIQRRHSVRAGQVFRSDSNEMFTTQTCTWCGPQCLSGSGQGLREQNCGGSDMPSPYMSRDGHAIMSQQSRAGPGKVFELWPRQCIRVRTTPAFKIAV
jgi:hypothetical protein